MPVPQQYSPRCQQWLFLEFRSLKLQLCYKLMAGG